MIGEIYKWIIGDNEEGKKYLNKAIDLILQELDSNYMLGEREKG